MYFTLETFFLLSLIPLASSIPTPQVLSYRDADTNSSAPQVFAHYMLITRPPNGDYTNDITLAASAGISAFALNYGGDGVDFDTQTSYLNDFYNTVNSLNTQNPSLNFKLFISIDTTSVTDASLVRSLYNQFASSPAQFRIDSKPVLSSFQTAAPAWDWETDIIQQLSIPPFFLPGTLSTTIQGALIPASSEYLNTDITTVGEQGMSLPAAAPGLLTWLHPTASMAEESATDTAFSQAQSSSDIAWVAPISPWFFKRLSATENWGQAQDSGIFIDRFSSLLALDNPPKYIELVTWNDFGESTYFGPADTTGICSSCYYDSLDHSAFLSMAKPFISAFKSGAKNVSVGQGEENVYMFYRTQPAQTLGWGESSSPAGDLGLPLNVTEWRDEVFVVGVLNQEANVTLNSGGNTHVFQMQKGVSKMGFEWGVGGQKLSIMFGNGTVVNKEGSVSIEGQRKWYNGNVVAV